MTSMVEATGAADGEIFKTDTESIKKPGAALLDTPGWFRGLRSNGTCRIRHKPESLSPPMVRPHCYLVKVRPGLLNLQTEGTFQTLATRDSFGPTGARLMSTHPLAG